MIAAPAAALFLLTLAIDLAPAKAQIDDSLRSHVLFDVQMDKFRDFAESMGIDMEEAYANGPGADEIPPEIFGDMNRVFGSFQLPKNMRQAQRLNPVPPGADFPVNFFVRLEFGSSEAASDFADSMWSRDNEKKSSSDAYYFVTDREAPANIAYWFPNPTTVEIGTFEYLKLESRRLFTKRAESVWNQTSDRAARLVVDVESVDGLISELIQFGKASMPPELGGQLDSVKSISTLSMSFDCQAENLFTFTIGCKDNDSAVQLKSALDQQLSLAKLMAAGSLSQFSQGNVQAEKVASEIINSMTALKSGRNVTLAIPRPRDFDTIIGEAFAELGQQDNLVARKNNLRQVALSVLNYESANRRFPFANDNSLSWRGHVSLFLEGPNVDPTAAHNSRENRRFTNQMPDSLGDNGETTGICCVVSERGTPERFSDIRDGSSNTIMLIETDKEIPWLEPTDLTIDQAARLFSQLNQGEIILVAMFDGSIREVSAGTDSRTIRALLTHRGGEVLNNW